jgi:hypothetical protein
MRRAALVAEQYFYAFTPGGTSSASFSLLLLTNFPIWFNIRTHRVGMEW